MVSGDALKRIAAAVQGYEHGDRKQSPIKFRIPVGDDDVVRLGKVSANWNKDDTATVQQYTGSGEEIEDAEFEAVNRFADVTVPEESSVWVACVLIDSTWHLVAAECS
jgi:hypothetical protein